MKDKKIIQLYSQKIKALEHNKYYFINDKPKISDAEYDELKNEVLKLEINFPI